MQFDVTHDKNPDVADLNVGLIELKGAARPWQRYALHRVPF